MKRLIIKINNVLYYTHHLSCNKNRTWVKEFASDHYQPLDNTLLERLINEFTIHAENTKVTLVSICDKAFNKLLSQEKQAEYQKKFNKNGRQDDSNQLAIL